MTIAAVEVLDVRFPTSRSRDGSDAMNPDPDYSAAYVILRTDAGDGLEGHGHTFTIGRGTEVVVAAIEALQGIVLGRDEDDLFADPGGFWRELVGDSQLRWIGPEKGVIHLATAALVNAVWDLRAKRAGKPLWKLLVDLSPEDVVRSIDFRYIDDVLTPTQALDLLTERAATKPERETSIRQDGYPAYTTSVGWLGYPDDKIRRLTAAAMDDGWSAFKMKVGADQGDDVRRAALIRSVIGPERLLLMDANQRWGVDEAIAWMTPLARFEPYWIEEPTSPDDILGHARIARAVQPIRVATGEHVHNRVMFKQYLQAEALSVCQVDACRLGGVNEVLAVLLLAARSGVPVCPHAGGVGLCELVQHLSIFDYVAVSGSTAGRMIEYVGHLHEHFVDPVEVRGGRYRVPTRPGSSVEMRPESLGRYRYPRGEAWRR